MHGDQVAGSHVVLAGLFLGLAVLVGRAYAVEKPRADDCGASAGGAGAEAV